MSPLSKTPMPPLQPLAEDTLSALMDGQLSAGESALAVQGLASNKDSCLSWHAYQVIGDVLRDANLAPTARELDFAQRLQSALAAEPLPARMGERVASPAPESPAPVQPLGAQPMGSANADVFRWKMVAAVATLGLGLVLALALRGPGVEGGQERLAGNSQRTVEDDNTAGYAIAEAKANAESPEAAMLRNPELDALLQAHQQMGGHSALQMPSGFLRNATFEGPLR